jgi:hypothetical protein
VRHKLSPLFPDVALISAHSGKYCVVEESGVLSCNSDTQQGFKVIDVDAGKQLALMHGTSTLYCASDLTSGAVVKCNQDRLR